MDAAADGVAGGALQLEAEVEPCAARHDEQKEQVRPRQTNVHCLRSGKLLRYCRPTLAAVAARGALWFQRAQEVECGDQALMVQRKHSQLQQRQLRDRHQRH